MFIVLTLKNILYNIFISFEQYLQERKCPTCNQWHLLFSEKQYHDWSSSCSMVHGDCDARISGEIYLFYPCKVHRHGDKDVTKKSYRLSSFVFLSRLCSYQMKLCCKCMYTNDVSDVQSNIIEIWYCI